MRCAENKENHGGASKLRHGAHHMLSYLTCNRSCFIHRL